MRFIVNIDIPHEPFNTHVREGKVGDLMGRIVEETKPEAIYFTEQGGNRGAVAIYNMDQNSQIPSIAEPWYLGFSARCQFRGAMTPEDLGNSGLDSLGKKWA